MRSLMKGSHLAGLPILYMAVLSSACAGGESVDNAGNLVPADQAIEKSTKDFEFGETADLGGGISIQVSNPSIHNDQYSTAIRVEARAENRGKNGEALFPSVGIVCSGSTEKGETIPESNMSILDSLPQGSYLEGVLLLYRPGDERTGSGVSVCNAPAVIRVEQQGLIEPGSNAADFPIPESLLNEINR